MKALVRITLVALLIIACQSFAQTEKPDDFVEFAKQKYLEALKSENYGVRNRTIFNILILKSRYPDQNYNVFIKQFNKMSQKDPCCMNRVHGNLAVQFLKNDQLVKSVDPVEYVDPVVFFNELYNIISEEPFAMR